MERIAFTRVKLPYGWLGNMAPYPVTWRGQSYRTTEAPYQAMRFTDLSIRELAELVRRVVGYAGRIAWDTSEPDGTPRKLMDSSRIFALGWRPEIPLEDGIRATYASIFGQGTGSTLRR